MNIQSKKSDNKLSGKTLICEDQYPGFSFRYMTANNNYNLNYFRDEHDKLITCEGLINKLTEFSKQPWMYWAQQRKMLGIEQMEYSRVRFKASDDARLNDDTKVYVIRFDSFRGSGEGRIIGFKESPCAILNIIGFDFDFSSYNHGK